MNLMIERHKFGLVQAWYDVLASLGCRYDLEILSCDSPGGYILSGISELKKSHRCWRGSLSCGRHGANILVQPWITRSIAHACKQHTITQREKQDPMAHRSLTDHRIIMLARKYALLVILMTISPHQCRW